MMDSKLMFLIREERSKENTPRTRKFIELPSSGENDEGNLNITEHRELEGFLQDAISSLTKGELVTCGVFYMLHSKFLKTKA